MKDQDKTKEQLLNELGELRQRIAELEAAKMEYERVAEALRESEERYRDIVELAPDGILTGNLKGVATSCNSAFLELTGFSRDEIVGTHISKFPTLRIEDIPKYAKMVFSEIQGKTTKPFEFIWVHKDGTERWGEAHMGLMKRDSKIIGLQLILRDITERKRMEEELENQRRLWDALMENALDLVYFKDNEHRLIRASQAYADVLGMDTEDLVGKIATELWPKEGEEIMADEQCVLAGEPLVRKERKVTTPEGESLWYLLTKIPIYADGEIIGFFAIDKDITERKRAQEALQEREQLLENVFESMQEGVLVLNSDFQYTNWNKAMERISHVPREEVLGRVPWDEFPFLKGEIEQAIRDARSGHLSRDVELAYTLASGEEGWTAESYFPLKDAEGSIVGVVGVVEDITERKRAEEALRESEEKYRGLVERSLQGVVIAQDGPVRLVFVSQPMEVITGFSLEELKGFNPQQLADLIHPQHREIFFKNFRARLRGQDVAPRHEYRILHRSGEERWVEIYSSWIEYEGTPATQTVFLDITERKRAEKALRKNEERLQLVLKGANLGLWDWNIQTGEVVFNDRWADMLGYTLDELEPHVRTWEELVHPDELNDVMETLNAHLEGKTDFYETEHRMRTKDGNWKWVLDQGQVLERDGQGKPLRAAGTHQDITERKQAEEILRKSKALLDATGRMAHVGGWELDAETLEVQWTEETYRIHGVPLDYKPPLQEAINFFHPVEREKLSQAIQRALDDGEPYDMELQFITAQGEHLWTRTICRPQIKDGKVVRLLGTFQDITERKQAEEALREREVRLRAIGDNLPAGLIYQLRMEKDGTARFTYVSAAVERLHECTVAEALNDPSSLFSRVVAEDLPDWTRATEKSINEMSLYDHTTRIRRKSGEIRWHRMIAKPRMADDGGILFDGIDMDVTEQKRAEEALWQSKRRLEKALTELRETQEQMVHQERMAAVGQLAAGIAHDFNNILAAITLYTQMSLKMSDLSPTIRKRLEVIAGQASRAADLIQQILDFGRRAVIERRPLVVDSFLKEVVKLLKRTLPEHVQIDLMIEPGEHVINADPTRVQQVIVNLALNARDAMPNGGMLHIALSTVEDKKIDCVECGRVAGGTWVQIEVSDDGTGIPPDVLPHIFEPFFTTRAPLGHGLGLAQVYGIVMQHDGHIEVETDIGQGTTFRLYWPALSVNKSDDQATVQPDVCRGEGQIILVVEDDAIMRATLVDVLEALGYRTLEAANGREALAVCEEHKHEISLVLSDWVMPTMGGADLARQLKARNIAIKVLMLTGHPLDEETRSVMSDNVVGWVLKPPKLERLAEAVAQSLGEEAESSTAA